MKMREWIYVTMFAMMCFTACDDDDDNGRELADTDETFVENVAMGNMIEVRFGTLAASKGVHADVREFGQMMVEEHNTAQLELKAIADDYEDIDWPVDMDDAHEQIYQQLMNLEGYKFDSLYTASQVMDHEHTLSLFETEVNTGKEQRVKDYATKFKPHIEMHLAEATTLHAMIMAQPPGN